jgi:hypothetical protein
LTTIPQSWTATTRSTLTFPVSVSTATSANCAPQVNRFQASSWFSARSTVAEAPSEESSLHASANDTFFAGSAEDVTNPPATETVSGETFHSFATASPSFFLAATAARRIVGALEGVVDEPPESGPNGIRVSPIRTEIFSSGSPSSSAATIATIVREPVPMSWTPCSTSAEPSRFSVTVARGPVPPVLYQTEAPRPTPRRIAGSSVLRRASRSFQPIFSAPILNSSRRTGEGSFLMRSSSGSMLSLAASSSIAASRAKAPWGWPGARKAAEGPALVKTSNSSTRRLGQA